MTLDELRLYIRTQLDMDEEELPNALLDSYLSEGFLRTISQDQMWPFYEHGWSIALVPSETSMLLPPNCDPVGIMSLRDSTSGGRLMQIGHELAEDNFVGTNAYASAPVYYSIFAGSIWLWPLPYAGAARNFELRGHRYPTDWVTAGPSASPDCDVRLHQLLAHYAIALCYAQQEDEVLEDVYMKRWQASYAAAHTAICRPRQHRPLILNGGLALGSGYLSGPAWNLPVA